MSNSANSEAAKARRLDYPIDARLGEDYIARKHASSTPEAVRGSADKTPGPAVAEASKFAARKPARGADSSPRSQSYGRAEGGLTSARPAASANSAARRSSARDAASEPRRSSARDASFESQRSSARDASFESQRSSARDTSFESQRSSARDASFEPRHSSARGAASEPRRSSARDASFEPRRSSARSAASEHRRSSAHGITSEPRRRAHLHNEGALDGDTFEPFRANFLTRRDLLLPVAGIAVAFALALILSLTGFGAHSSRALSEIDISSVKNDSPIKISEVCSSNSGYLKAPDGGFYDWIEVENTSDAARSLAGLLLTDDISSSKLYPLPDVTLAPGECALIYASGTAVSAADQPMYAGFKLSSAGEPLYLLTDSHELYDYVQFPALNSGESYARDFSTGIWQVSTSVTPGVDNAAFYSEPQAQVNVDSAVKISEIQPVNCASVRDADGDYSDWIEIYNSGDSDVDITGWGLSDAPNRPLKWTFPNYTLKAGQYALVFASGKNRKTGELHTGFKLDSSGGKVTLSNSDGGFVSIISYPEARADASYALDANGAAQELLVPTPGASNADTEAALNARAAQNASGIFIDEVLASNSVKTDANPNDYDYIELRNLGGASVDLSGMGLSDNPANPRKWQFPDGATLGSGEYLAIYCGGVASYDVQKGKYFTNFRISSGGCTITLSDPDGTIIDECALPKQYGDVSYGLIDGVSGFTYIKTPTPGAQNDTESYLGKLADVKMSAEGGLMDAPVALTLSAEDGAQIYYTTDMTDPTTGSTQYTGPINISSTTIIRAAAFKDGYLPSYVSTESYFYGLDHKLPVVSLVADPKYLFDWDTGLLVKGPNAFEEEPYGRMGAGANFWMGWEYPANVEYFDENGKSLSSDKIGIKIIGQDSRAQDQKGIAMYARTKYGDKSIDFNPFSTRDFTSYRSLTLRPSGEDAQYTHLRDASLSSLAEGTNALNQATAPVVLYINGQCWGVYNLRERINKYYVAQHEDITDSTMIDNVNMIKGDANALNGSLTDYKALLKFVSENSLKDEANLKYVTDRIDLDNYIDYVLFEILIGNTDSGNIKYYDAPMAGVKWKWIVYDLDWAMYTMDENYFERYLNSEGHGVRSMFDNSLIRALLKNDGVKDKFLKRMAELMTGNLSPANIKASIENYKNLIYPDMKYQFEKWGSSYARWEKYVANLEDNVNEYAQNALDGAKEFFGLTDEQMESYFGSVKLD